MTEVGLSIMIKSEICYDYKIGQAYKVDEL